MDLRNNMKEPEPEKDKVDAELLERTLAKIPTAAAVFLEHVPNTKGVVRIKNYQLLAESLLVSCLNGFEYFCMGEVFEYTDTWAPEYFGLAMNYLIAEYFGKGTVCNVTDWLSATERAVSALTQEGYKKNQRITPDVVRSYLNNLTHLHDLTLDM